MVFRRGRRKHGERKREGRWIKWSAVLLEKDIQDRQGKTKRETGKSVEMTSVNRFDTLLSC